MASHFPTGYFDQHPPELLHTWRDHAPKRPEEPERPGAPPEKPDIKGSDSDNAEAEKKHKAESEEYERTRRTHEAWGKDDAKAVQYDADWANAISSSSQDQIKQSFQGAQALAEAQHKRFSSIQTELKNAQEKIAQQDRMDENQCHENVKLRTWKKRYQVAFILLATATSIAIPAVVFWMHHKLGKMQRKAVAA